MSKILCFLFSDIMHRLLILDALKLKIEHLRRLYNVTPLRYNEEISSEAITVISKYNSLKYFFMARETDIRFKTWFDMRYKTWFDI